MSGYSQPNSKPSVCFVALNAYDALSARKNIGHIGGAEVQQVRIASWLVQRGYRVSFITLDRGQPDGIDLGGIRTFKAYAEADGIRGLRFLHPRWSGLWSAMTRADADVYYQRAAGNETGQVALWCSLHHRKYIFAAANDSDCDSSLYALKSWREKRLYRLGLRLADAVTAQTATQQRLMRQNMGRSTILVRNCGWDLADGAACVRPVQSERGAIHVLWVGRITEQKRFDRLLDVAEQCPEIGFDAVGAPDAAGSYTARLLERAATLSNVKMHGRIPYERMAEQYRRCSVLCCTSAYEGFPNIFLEAWSVGMPVVSTVDPDGAIASYRLGFVAQDVAGIVTGLTKLLHTPEIWLEASQAARKYFLDNHTPEACLPQVERLLLEVSQGQSSGLPAHEEQG